MSEQGTSFRDYSNENSEKGAKELFGLGEVPSDWGLGTLSELAEIIPGNSPPSSTYNDSGDGLPFFQGNADFGFFNPTHETWCSAPRKVAEPGDVLISIRAPVGDLNMSDKRCCIGRGLSALRSERLNNLYLYYHLGVRQAWLSRLATGSTFKAITKGDLERLEIPEPPLEEQRKIASVLYSVDQAIQKTKNIREQYERLIVGTRRKLLREGIGLDKAQQNTPTGAYPEAWNMVRTGNHVELRNGEFLAKDDRTEDGDYPVYGGNGIMGRTNDHFVGADTVIIGRVGAYCGNVHVTDQEAWVTDNAIIISELSDSYRPSFIAHLLDQIGLGQFAEQSAQPRISQSTVENMRIPMPPSEEQRQIVQVLSSLENSKKTTIRERRQLEHLKQGLMQDLLSGEVRTHDKNIEIAEEVLAHG